MSVDTDRVIRAALHIKRGDLPPYTGWSRAKVTRAALPSIFNQCGFTCGAEIGVRIGTFSEQLCQGVPGLSLIGVDPWAPYDRHTQESQERCYQAAVRHLAPYHVRLLRMTSLEAAQQIADASLDFVYIDAAHNFDNVMLDLILWARKVRRGGIVSGHDYFEFYQAGVVSAVRAYTQAHGIAAWYLTTEQDATWLWVRR